MSKRSHSVTAAVDHRVVWEHWTNTDHWPADNPLVAKAQINGPLAKGALGIVYPVGGRRQGFRIVVADQQNHRFAIRLRLLLAYLTVEFSLQRPQAGDAPDAATDAEGPNPHLWVLTHTLLFTGPAARLWDRLRGRAIADSFPGAMAAIVDAAAV